MIIGQVITGSWDKSLKCWDPRGASGQERTLVGTYPQPERVYSLSLVGNRLVVATAGRHVNVYDLRNMSQPEQRRESSLKYQTRCVRCYPNGTGKITLYSWWVLISSLKWIAVKIYLVCDSSLLWGLFSWYNLFSCTHLYAGYALSSVEGRVAMEFFDLSEASQAKKYMPIFLLSCSVFRHISLVWYMPGICNATLLDSVSRSNPFLSFISFLSWQCLLTNHSASYSQFVQICI